MDYTKSRKSSLPSLKPSKYKIPKKGEKKPRKWLVLVGVLLILAGVVFAYFLVTQKDGKMKEGQEIKVPFDLDEVKNEQKSVDEGHSPWKLDPLYVAQVFVSLQISPEGIVGDYPVKIQELNLIQMTKSEAVVHVKSRKTPITMVHLKRLVRQDSTGIWTVVAYEVAEDNNENIPSPGKENPEPAKENPEPGKENSEPGKENPVPGKDNPEADKENPAPGNENPAPGKENPEPGKENPKPGQSS